MKQAALHLPRLPKAVFWLIAFAVLMFIPAKGHAQTNDYGWYPGFQTPGTNCYVNSTGGTLCGSAGDACQSIGEFYSSSYAFLVEEGVPFLGDTGIYNSGLACTWIYAGQNTVGGVNLLVPQGYLGDPNTPTGSAPPGTGTVQSPKQVGGGNCGCDGDGDPTPDDDDQDSWSSSLSDADSEPTPTGNNSAGDPINVPSGNMSYHHTDYTTSGQNPLALTRYYNSRGAFTVALGVNWRTSYDRFVWLFYGSAPYTKVGVQRADGQMFYFTLTNGVWSSDTDVDYTLTNTGSTWVLTDPDDTVETYLAVTTGYAKGYVAQLQTIKSRNGYTKTLAYNSLGQVSTVTDSYNRTLTFNYTANQLTSITTPDSTTITYGFSSTNSAAANLTTVMYPTSQTFTYVYGNTSLPHMLTGLIDDNNSRYLTWTYDAYGRALTSQIGTGSNATLTTVAYNDTNGSRTVTNALGSVNTYTYTTLQNAQKLTGISRAATSTTAAATRAFTYDSNGYLASSTDWNGNSTTYVNNAHGKPTTINEAVGSAVARTTTIAYDPTWVHLPHTITTPGLTTGFTYDSEGEQLTKTLTDTTTTTVPYSTSGQSRTWTQTWSNALLASVKTPNSHTTTFGYDSSGALTSITDALSHITHITSHSGGGLPESVTDPNGVVTTKTYDQRQRIYTSSIATTAGALETSYEYDNGGDVRTNLPDGSTSITLLDSAHRLAGLADTYDEQKGWGLDALGDATSFGINDRNGNNVFSRSATFDAIGRKLKDTSNTTGASTVLTYDSNGNALIVTDPLSHTTTNVYDALNRLITSTDANSGIMTVTYDPHNRPLTIKDKIGNITSYVYDGFGDKIQQVSPDSGMTVYHYDGDANLTSKTDAASVVTNWTYDALDRPLTTTYPADTAENVAYTWDQTGHGFGIGRLTSVTDAAGSLSRTYDERGNRLTDKRTIGTTVLTTTYTFDKASRVASLTYPSGATVTYARDSIGDIIDMPFAATGADLHNVAVNLTHLPWGPLNSWDPENGDRANLAFDQDYRLTSIAYASYPGTTKFLNWTYGYDNANNITSITDSLTAANSQAFTYDVLNRLSTAASSGTYGNLSYAYDKNNNLTTWVTAGTNTLTYVPGTNRLSTITYAGNTENYSYTATGNMSGLALGSSPYFAMGYNKANRLTSVTGSGVSVAMMSATYDFTGKRITKGDNGSPATLFTYDLAGNLIEENNSGTITDYIYADGVNIGNWEPSEGHLYMVYPDSRGVPILSHDAYGLTNWAAYSTPYGDQTQTVTSGQFTGPVTQNLRLPGQYYDHEAGFFYNGHRDYLAGVGRYLESDPFGLGGGLNGYGYAGANPFTFIDRSGLQQSIQNTNESDPMENYKEQNEIFEQARSPAEGFASLNELMKSYQELNEPSETENNDNFLINTDNLPAVYLQQFNDYWNTYTAGPQCTKANPNGDPMMSPASPEKYAVLYRDDATGQVLFNIVNNYQLQMLKNNNLLLNH